MKKIILLIIMLCLVNNMQIKNAFADSESYVKPLYSIVNIYKDTNINIDCDGEEEDLLDVISTAKYGDKLLLADTNIIVGEDGFNYYKVMLNINNQNIQAYVLWSNVISSDVSSLKRELDYNATINKQTNIYIYEELQFIKLDKVLPINTKIKILEDRLDGYTRIQYKDSDGDIQTVYAKTDDITIGGISRTTIGTIIIVVTTVSLVLVVFGIKGNRKRKKKKI